MITAMITPFLCDGALDLDGLKSNIKFQLEQGAEGLLVLGTTGESPTITSNERRQIILAAAELTKNRATLYVGTGTASTASTIDLTNEAYQLGADVALIVTPYYNCPTQQGYIAHINAILDETKLPLCLYNHPRRTGTSLTLETLLHLAPHEKILGVKDCSGDLSFAAHLIHQRPKGFKYYSGDDAFILALMALGADGVISVVSNLLPRELFDLVALCREHNFEKARDTFYKLLPDMDALFKETNPISVKAAMESAGLPAGKCRLPLA